MGTEPVPSPMNGHPRELVVVPWPFRDPTGFYTDVWAALNSSMKPPDKYNPFQCRFTMRLLCLTLSKSLFLYIQED